MAPEVSLIVNTYQKPRHLALVLESIALQTGIDAAMELVVADDGVGTNTISLGGADAANFEVIGASLYLRAGTGLNAQAKPAYSITVQAADTTLAGSTPVTTAFNLTITGGGINVPTGQTSTDLPTRTGSYQLVKQGGGTLILDKPNSHSGGTVVEAGRVVVKNASALGTGQVRIKAGATLVIDPSAGEVQAGSLVIEDGGFVDLGTGRIRIVSGMTASDLVTILLAAKGDGTWTGTTGLGSSAVANAVANFEARTLGWLDNGDGSFTVGFAAPGDTTLDGVVDITDVANFLSSGKLDSGEQGTWDTGDFNLDGVVDQLDLADFLGTSLYDAGPYVPSESGMMVEPSAASQAAGSVGSGSSESTAIQSAFAALATEAATSTRDKRKVFAAYR